jgi:hypothetical protein
MSYTISDKLLKPQRQHAKTLLDSIYLHGYASDFSDLGTGKTYVAAAVAAELKVPIVVVCPKIVIPNWHKILNMFGVKGALVINYEKLCRGGTKWLKYDKKKFFNKKNWQSVGISLHFPKNCLVICDEVHKCKGNTSLNSDFLLACKNHKYKLLMASATAATSPVDMKAYGYAANLHTGENFSEFCTAHGAVKNRFGGMSIDMASLAAQKGMQKIHHKLFNEQKSVSRMTVDMFTGIFPDNHIMAEAFDMGNNTAKINRVYALMQAELDRLDQRAQNYSSHIFAIIMEARRRTELLKVPALVEMVEDMFEEGLSPVVFLNFTDSIQAMHDRLKNHKKISRVIGKIVGGQKNKDRHQDIDEFNADILRVMLVNMRAGNAGISLHDLNGKFPRSSLLIPSFSALDLLQATGRIARQGGLTKCRQKIVFSSGTIEEQACERVQVRLDCLSSLNDNDLLGGINVYR